MKQLIKKLLPMRLFAIIEPYGHLVEAIMYNIAYGFPARRFKVIGVTGTNGKTTTSFMIHRMLYESGFKVGLMTTVAYGVGDNIHPQVEHMTSVPVPILMKRLKQMKAEGAEWVVLETTSHALAQHRVWGVPYSIAVMTNVTHEHLDYHRTFERYRDAKARLFTITARNRKGKRVGIVNADDPSAQTFASKVPHVISYGLEKGDLRARDVQSDASGSQFVARYEQRSIAITTKLAGGFNVSNSLAAVGVGIALGLGDEQIAAGIAALAGVAGRMNSVRAGQNFDVLIDFAHTPDSFEKLLPELKKITKGRLIVMFGSPGRRDETKRAIQGGIAGKFADVVVVTEEDDRDADGMQIMNQIAAGAEAEGKVRERDLFLVHDRTKAINTSLRMAKPGDSVVLLGKGHETSIERADGEHPWDEEKTVREVLDDMSLKLPLSED